MSVVDIFNEPKYCSFFSKGAEKRASEDPIALPAGSEEQEIETISLSGVNPEETKRLRGDRAEQIKSLSAADFRANKAALIAELKLLPSKLSMNGCQLLRWQSLFSRRHRSIFFVGFIHSGLRRSRGTVCKSTCSTPLMLL